MILKRISKKMKEVLGSKENAEYLFWKDQIEELEKWYSGELTSHFRTPCPKESEKVLAPNLKDSSVLTWFNLHQKVKYLADLKLDDQFFSGKKLLDVGAGPMPSATVFKNCDLYCLEPLVHKYLEAGYPIHYYGNFKYIHAPSENIPIEDNFFDAVISVNAIDHVNNIRKTSMEIKRVLKENGLFRMHVHYHKSTKWEPVVLNDEIFMDLFSWCKDLHKISESKTSYSLSAETDERFTLWSNFDTD